MSKQVFYWNIKLGDAKFYISLCFLSHLSYIMKRHNHELRFAKIFDSLTKSFYSESCKGDSKKSNNKNKFLFHVTHEDLHIHTYISLLH